MARCVLRLHAFNAAFPSRLALRKRWPCAGKQVTIGTQTEEGLFGTEPQPQRMFEVGVSDQKNAYMEH